MTLYVPTRPAGTVPPGTNQSPQIWTAHTSTECPLTLVAAPGQTAPLLQVGSSTTNNNAIYLGGALIGDFPNQNYCQFDAGGLSNMYLSGATTLFVTESTLIINPSAANAALVLQPPAGDSALLAFAPGGTYTWQIYEPSSTDPNLYFRDLVNARMQLQLFPSATAPATIAYSYLTIQPPSTSNAIVYLNATSPGFPAINWQNAGVNKWVLYWDSGGLLFMQDSTSGRQIAGFAPGSGFNTSGLYLYGSLILNNGIQSILGMSNPQANDCAIANGAGYVQLDAINGVLLAGAGGLTTTSTQHFPYMPAVAGTPTGVPNAITNWVPFRYDTTAHKLWIYDAGWKGVVVA